jgi:K+-transporting ATPase ATPase A chain
MTANTFLQLALFLVLLVALAVPLGGYMARVYSGEAHLAQRIVGPFERLLYRLSGVREDDEMTWKQYTASVLCFNLLGALMVYLLQRVQASLPLNPNGLANVPPEVSFNTAVSFATNTNGKPTAARRP